MYYTYRLRSLSFPRQSYIGSTSDLKRRLAEHNSGKCYHTAKFMPWEVDFAAVFCYNVRVRGEKSFESPRCIWLRVAVPYKTGS